MAAAFPSTSLFRAAKGSYTEKLDMLDLTNETVKIVGISGSLRQASFSTALLKILAEKALPAIELQVVTLQDIPLYNADLDRRPEIPAVAAFKRTIAQSDGVLIATPEYSHGVPGVLKNALDWASGPVFESCFKDKPVSIISSSWAFTGGVRAQYQLRETLISLQAHLVMGPEVLVGGVHTKLADNTYTDGDGLAFMLTSLARLREEILGRRVVGVEQWRSQVESLELLVAELLSANECLREIVHDHESIIEQN
jgi:chromate reductase, NAD(P)H dehydrogenase (quinone)